MTSMNDRWRNLPRIFGTALLIGALGCEGLKDPPGKPDPIATAPASVPEEPLSPLKDLKPKQAALPKLPKGAGEIDEDAPDELTPTPSGLYYRILRKSDGRKPTTQNRVVVNYRGTLDNGSQFDSSYDRAEPSEFGLTQVIKGWTEGLQLIGEGGMIELEIPYWLAYGPMGSPPRIPGKATLHFLIELKEVK
jgi:FKBP-type peptidyl-prolyl cis-trans isomerase FkpA/FKBP-type peptidyl-prolyl cis-trans isomerase FklB